MKGSPVMVTVCTRRDQRSSLTVVTCVLQLRYMESRRGRTPYGTDLDKLRETAISLLTEPGKHTPMTSTTISDRSPKSKWVDFFLGLFLGALGVHRFYEGKITTGVIYLLTLGVLGAGVVADLLQILLGVRVDKQGRHIGTHRQAHRGAIKAASIVAGIVVIAVAAASFVHYNNNKPLIQDEEYYRNTDATLPQEKTYAGLGPEKTSAYDAHHDADDFTTFYVDYPSAVHDNDKKYPVVVFANGSNAPVALYRPILKHLASWGFIVVGNDDATAGTGASTSATLDFILAQGADPDSAIYDSIDTDHIGLVGASQGGAGALRAATDYDNSSKFTSVFTLSATALPLIAGLRRDGMKDDWTYDPSKLTIPYAAVAGTGTFDSKAIAPLVDMKATYNALPEGVPAVIARRNDADHPDMLIDADAYMTAWFRYTLMGDSDAASVFIDPEPELAQNTDNWRDFEAKNLFDPSVYSE